MSGRDYDDYAPLLAEHAALGPTDPRREQVRAELVDAFLPVARNVARRFSHRGEPTEDLEQVASLGLLHALDRFDPGRERDFLSYAIPTIMGEVRRYFRDAAWSVRTPRSVKDRYLLVGATTARLSQHLGRAPTVAEIAAELELSRDQVAEAVAAHGSYQPASLDESLGDGDDGADSGRGSSLVDILGVADDDLDRVEARELVGSLVRALPERERTMLGMRFVQEKTQSEIAAVLCISQMHVSRLLTRTLAQLREQLGTSADAPRRAVRSAGSAESLVAG